MKPLSRSFSGGKKGCETMGTKRNNKRIGKQIGAVLTLLFLFISLLSPAAARTASPRELNPTVDTAITNVGNYILSVDKKPEYGSMWNVLGLVRSGRDLPTSYTDTFYNNTLKFLKDSNWQITKNRYSDYSKLILAMTVIGRDAEDICGHNLLEYLADFSKVKKQGFNGPIWALIALKSHPTYEIPEVAGVTEQTTEEGLVEYLLSKQLTKEGQEGWTLTWNAEDAVPDTDITAMTIQALSSYYGRRDDVTSAVDKALAWLSSSQDSKGGYSTLNGSGTVENSESDAQVIVALSSIGIDCGTDERFIKPDGAWVLSRLMDYYKAADDTKGGFIHVFEGAENNGGGAAGKIDGLATEQGMYALAAYTRLQEGKTALYDMSDITLVPGEDTVPDDSSEGTTEEKAPDKGDTPKPGKIKVSRLLLDYKQITMTRGKTRTLKLKIYPSNAADKRVKWKSSNKKIATVTAKGKIKALKAGTVKITVTARDGSRKKAVCKVIIKNPASARKNSGKKTNTGNRRSSTSGTNTGSNGQRGYNSQSGTGYVPVVSGGNTGQGNYPGTTVTGSGSGGTTSQESTEAVAWNFDGNTYNPESSSEDTEASVQDETGEDTEGEEGYEGDGEDPGNPGPEHPDTGLPAWLEILLGLLLSGGLAGSFRVPWKLLAVKALKKIKKA